MDGRTFRDGARYTFKDTDEPEPTEETRVAAGPVPNPCHYSDDAVGPGVYPTTD